MVFKGGSPSELFTPQGAERKTQPQKKYAPQLWKVDPFAQKMETAVAIRTYTIDVPDSTMDQPKQN